MSGVIIPDGGTIGSVSDTDAISIASDGKATLSQKPTFSQGIANTGTIDAGTLGSSVVVPASIGGTFVFLEKFTASSTTEKIFNLDSYTSYNKYLFLFNDIRPVTDGANFQMVTGTASDTFNTSSGDYRGAAVYGFYDNTNIGRTQDVWNDFMYEALGVGDNNGEGLCGQFFIYNPLNSSLYTSLNGTMTYLSSGHYVRGQSIGAIRIGATDDAYIKMYFSSNSIATGTITLYGVKDA